MRRAARVGVFAGAVCSGLLASAAAVVWHRLARRPLPQVEGTIEVPELRDRVRVRRDRWGVPHIEAEDREDLFFAQGYCHGQDRLWQMNFYRRVVEGRVAEMAGEEGLAVDKLMRTLGIRRVAEAEEAAMEPELRAKLERFCAGVNAAARDARAMPFEMQVLRQEWKPWRPVDILSLGKLLAFGLSTNWERELLRADMVRELGPELAARLDPVYPADNPVVAESLEAWTGEGMPLVEQIDRVRGSLGLAAEASGSNNWAVSAARSKSGTPLIAGDPHLSPSMPGIWYEVELRHGGRFVRGASLPGMPGIYMGQNNDVCWTITNVMADVQDLFVERIEGDSYLFEDEWRPLDVVREEIVVKGRSEPVVLEVRSTHHGPIVNEALGADDGEPLALAFQTLRESTAFEAAFELLDITSGPELVAELEGHTSPASNMVWADSRGSIGYKLIGRLPMRRGGCPDLPKPGWSGEHEWEGTVPYEELPEVVDPECGYVITANNRIVGDDYPHHITSDWLDGFRAKRIEEMIKADEKHDLESFEAIQNDNYSLPGIEAAARLSRLHPAGQRERSALERLRSWDGNLDPDSIAGTIYQAFLLRLAREVARAAIGDRDLCERWLDRADNGFLPHVTSPWRWHSHLMALWAEGDEGLIGRPWDGLVLEALAGALDDLSDRFGPEPEGWRWGRVHELKFPHPLGDANPLFDRFLNRRLRAGGAQETVSQIAYDPNDPYNAVWAPSWRMLADPTDPDRSRWQMFTGQSGHPASPHYDDLQVDWLDGRTQPMRGDGPWSELDLVSPGMPRTKLFTSLVLSLLCLLAPASAQALPRGFFGIAPQTPLGAPDLARMSSGGVETVRLALPWAGVQRSPRSDYDWSGFDAAVAEAAKKRIGILPVLGTSPGWATGDWRRMPVDGGRARRGWADFVRAAVERYEPGGEFWAEHARGSDEPLPPVPIRAWQIWNEENFFYFVKPVSPGRFARLLAITAPAIRRADPRAEIVLGGLFGSPKQRPPRAIDAVDFLDQLYRRGGVKANFDAVALHPYAANVAELRRQVEAVRATMARHGDRRSGLYITEMGWGSAYDPGTVAFEVGLHGQARELRGAYRYLIANHGRLKLRQVDWFSWKDLPGACNFCDSSGLFRAGAKFRPKPAWRTFVSFAR